MKTGILLVLLACLFGCGSGDSSTCFPLGNGKYCIDDADCQLQNDGKVLCAPGSNYGTMFAAVNEKDGKMQLCVKNKDTGSAKCFDPESECTTDATGQLSCQDSNFMAEDPCVGKPCTGECAQCGQYTWCASTDYMDGQIGTCQNACLVAAALQKDKIRTDCKDYASCRYCQCFTQSEQAADLDGNCVPLNDFTDDCATESYVSWIKTRMAETISNIYTKNVAGHCNNT